MYVTIHYIYSSVIILENDRPDLRDLVNLVVPIVHHKWYNLGLQLLDSKEVTFLQSLRTQYHNSCDQCREVFIHWLEVSKKPTWDYILKALTAESVKLTSVANGIKKMLSSKRKVRTV